MVIAILTSGAFPRWTDCWSLVRTLIHEMALSFVAFHYMIETSTFLIVWMLSCGSHSWCFDALSRYPLAIRVGHSYCKGIPSCCALFMLEKAFLFNILNGVKISWILCLSLSDLVGQYLLAHANRSSGLDRFLVASEWNKIKLGMLRVSSWRLSLWCITSVFNVSMLFSYGLK